MFDYAHFLYKRIISENPYFIEAYIKLCDLYKMRGNKTKAEYYIKLAIDKHFMEKKEKDENEIKEIKDKENEELKTDYHFPIKIEFMNNYMKSYME